MDNSEFKILIQKLIDNSDRRLSLTADDSLTLDQIKELKQAFKLNKSVNWFQLELSLMSPEDIKDILSAHPLQAIELHKRLGVDNILLRPYLDPDFIADIIRTNPLLEHLTLVGVDIGGDEGARTIGLALKDNKSLQQLSLNGCNISDAGLRYIFSGLKENKNLTKLILESNNITDLGVEFIANELNANTYISQLNLAKNKFNSDGFTVCRLIKDTVLQGLILSSSELNAAAAKNIAEALQTNTCLTNLVLSHNHLESDGAKSIAYSLKNNTMLQTLDLHDNQINDNTLNEIRDFLNKNSLLKAMFLEERDLMAVYSDNNNHIQNAINHNKFNLTTTYFQLLKWFDKRNESSTIHIVNFPNLMELSLSAISKQIVDNNIDKNVIKGLVPEELFERFPYSHNIMRNAEGASWIALTFFSQEPKQDEKGNKLEKCWNLRIKS